MMSVLFCVRELFFEQEFMSHTVNSTLSAAPARCGSCVRAVSSRCGCSVVRPSTRPGSGQKKTKRIRPSWFFPKLDFSCFNLMTIHGHLMPSLYTIFFEFVKQVLKTHNCYRSEVGMSAFSNISSLSQRCTYVCQGHPRINCA